MLESREKQEPQGLKPLSSAVDSGMAKAIIHNSDYPSAEAAREAIDQYFQERNEHFVRHPKREC